MNTDMFGPLHMLGSPCEERASANADQIQSIEQGLQTAAKETVAQRRIKLLVDPDTFLPLGSLFDPEHNPEGGTGAITGLAKVHGHCVCVIASNPEVCKGAWLPGQPEKILRIQEVAMMLHVPIFTLLQCSGLHLGRQHRVYSGRRSGGRIFYNNAELANEIGTPIIAGIFGTNTAGGGYGAISATKRFAHKDASMSIAGTAILSGMSASRNGFSIEDVDMLIAEIKKANTIPPPGSAVVHTETGLFDHVFDTEEEVIDAMRGCLTCPVPRAQRDWPDWPDYDVRELYTLLPHDRARSYDIKEVLARIVDRSMAREYMPAYGPEVYCAYADIDGCAVGIVANRQGFLPRGYPDYATYDGIGGKLYRQGLIKMQGFVAWCGANKIPMVWLQDTTGIDVGDEAELAGLLGLGQALIAAIVKAKIPMATVELRKAHAASHYVQCGPMATANAMTLGTALTEIMVMHPQSAAMALYGNKLLKAASREAQQVVINEMNALMAQYRETSSPRYAAQHGIVDEVVRLTDMRSYLSWFAQAAHDALKVSEVPVESLWNLPPV
ncbi:glutaconyl-CoA decarboxylase subunit alpha [Candidatus Kaiserbacteria bacterium]|nr:glutaconyl-CoA decarboxylase subunit alpha [Candidatus Kaiserbacteria bacterium]